MQRKSYVVSLGVKAGSGKMSLGLAFYRSVFNSEAEAQMMHKIDMAMGEQ